MIEIKELNIELEPFFYKHISNDEPNYYFFILDWKYSRENKKIKGTMLVYKNQIVHIRGSPDATKSLLDRIDIDNIEATCYEEHKVILFKKYKPTMEHRLILMKLDQGTNVVHPKHTITKLSIEDAEETSNLMGDALPDFWNQLTTENISSRIKEGDP